LSARSSSRPLVAQHDTGAIDQTVIGQATLTPTDNSASTESYVNSDGEIAQSLAGPYSLNVER